MPKNGSFEVLFVLTVIFLYFFRLTFLQMRMLGGVNHRRQKSLGLFNFNITFVLALNAAKAGVRGVYQDKGTVSRADICCFLQFL